MSETRGYAWLGQGKAKKPAQPPPVDWLRAIILDRIESMGDRKEAAEACGMKYDSFRRLLKRSPREWKAEQLQAVITGLQISKKDYTEAWARYAQ